MGRIRQAMGEFFGRAGWAYLPRTPTRWELRYTGEASFTCFASVFEDDDDGLFLFETVCPIDIPTEKRAEMAALCNHINWRAVIGSVAFDTDTGELRVRSSLYLDRWSPVEASMIGPVVQFNVDLMDSYLPAIASVVAGDASADWAFALIVAD